MVEDVPVLMDYREKSIHLGVNSIEMRRDMIADIDWLFAIPSTELSDVRYGCMI